MQNGHANVPTEYLTKDGVKLGKWLLRVRNQKREGKLTAQQIERLEGLGVQWQGNYVRAWEQGFAAAKEYFSAHGHLNVLASYKTGQGFKLGDWISNQREKFRKGKMEEIRKQRLDSIGMIWEKVDSWEVRFALAKTYFEEHGDLRISTSYKVNGIWLNKWINEQKQIYRGNRKARLHKREFSVWNQSAWFGSRR